MPATAYAPRAKLGEAPRRLRAGGGSATGPRLRPTAVVGEPYPFPPSPPAAPTGAPGLQVPEPAALVGMQSGQHYATLGDNPMGPETMTVAPPPEDITLGREGPPPVQARPGLPVSMEDGGTATIGGWGRAANFGWAPPPPPAPVYQEPAPVYYPPPQQQQQGWANTLQQIPAYQAPAAPAYNPDQYAQLRGAVNTAQQGVLGAQGQQLDARAATLPYYQRQLDAQRAVLPYSRGVLNAQAGLLGPQQNVIGANRAVLGAQQGSLAAQRGYIAQQQGANAQELLDIQGIRMAQANLADQTAVAQERQLRGAVDRSLYNRLGVEAPTEVDVEPMQEGMLPPGMRAKLKTQEDIRTKQAQYNAQVRSNQLQNARLAVSLIDTNVDEARLKASEAGLTLDQAKLLVDQAQLAEGRAQLGAKASGFDVEQSRLGEQQAELGYQRARLGESQASYNLNQFDNPKDEGYELYTDPVTLRREWLTPDEANRRQYDYSTQQGYERIPSQYALGQSREQYQSSRTPLSGYNRDALLDMYENDPGLGGSPEGLQALIGYYMERGATPTQAAYEAGRLVNDADAARVARAKAAAGGGTSATAKAIEDIMKAQAAADALKRSQGR